MGEFCDGSECQFPALKYIVLTLWNPVFLLHFREGHFCTMKKAGALRGKNMTLMKDDVRLHKYKWVHL